LKENIIFLLDWTFSVSLSNSKIAEIQHGLTSIHFCFKMEYKKTEEEEEEEEVDAIIFSFTEY